MHTSGKVAVWLVVLAAVGATVLTSKLIQVRNSWTRKAVAAQTEYHKVQPEIARLQEELDRLQGDLFRARELWGTPFINVPTSIREPALVIDIGTNQGLRDKQTLYGFEILADGSVVYRGDFTVTTTRDLQSQLLPNWKVRPEDVSTWKSGQWRWRNQIPPAYQQNFDKQILAVATANDVMADRRQSVGVQTQILAQSQEQLQMREAELVGGDQLSKDPAVDVEYREGLVAAVEQTEEARNQVLQKVDDLRRRLRTVRSEVDQLQKRNLELTNKLPQPVKTEVSSKP